jgi:hypothetical protein
MRSSQAAVEQLMADSCSRKKEGSPALRTTVLDDISHIVISM